MRRSNHLAAAALAAAGWLITARAPAVAAAPAAAQSAAQESPSQVI